MDTNKFVQRKLELVEKLELEIRFRVYSSLIITNFCPPFIEEGSMNKSEKKNQETELRICFILSWLLKYEYYVMKLDTDCPFP